VPYKSIPFFLIYIISFTYLFIRVYIYIGVISRVLLIRVLLTIITVYKVSI
jgi:hypothetical protein